MHVKRLAQIFENERSMPIELPELATAVADVLLVQDKIIFSPQDMDPELCKGAYNQYTHHTAPYSPPVWVSLIVYSNRVDIPWQRMVCCKELMHVLDKHEYKTRTPEQVEGLSEKLLGKSAVDSFGLADFQAAEDRFALYRALAVIFPPAARDDAIMSIKSGEMTVSDVAAQVSIPEPLLEFALRDDWPQIRQDILDC